MKQKIKDINQTVKYTVPILEMLVTYKDLPHSIAFSEVGLEPGINKCERDKIRQPEKEIKMQ